jgi:hypothetical protein
MAATTVVKWVKFVVVLKLLLKGVVVEGKQRNCLLSVIVQLESLMVIRLEYHSELEPLLLGQKHQLSNLNFKLMEE